MTVAVLVDFSFARPSPASLVQAKVAGVLRYVTWVAGKCITAAEAASYRAVGLSIGLVYEDGANDFAGGEAAGTQKAQVAAPVLQALGFPTQLPVYCAVDTGLDPSLYEVTYQGIHQFCSLLGRPDAMYGPRPFAAWCETEHGMDYFWETAASSENTGPEPSSKRLQQLVYQPAGVGALGGVDYDLATQPNWGQWGIAHAPPMPAAKGKPTPADLQVADMTPLRSVAEAQLALSNGWHLFYWTGTAFYPQIGGYPRGAALYAHAQYHESTN